MQVAKRYPPPHPAHQTQESEITVWIMVLALLGLTAFALLTLLYRVGW